MEQFFKISLVLAYCLVLAIAAPVDLLAETKPPIKIGATLMLTGYGATWGKNAQQGIELALAKVNAVGGISGRPLQVIYEDFGEMDLKRAAAAAQKLVAVDGVYLMLTLIIEDSEVVCPIAQRAGLLTLSVGAGSRESSELCPSLFRSTSTDETLVDLGVDYAISQKKQNACILANQVRYYESYADYTAEKWKQKTGAAAKVFKFPWATTDFGSLLTKVKASNCDVYFMQTGIPAQGMLLKQAKTLRISGLFVGPPTSDDSGVLSVAGRAAEGLVFARYREGTPEFVKDYSAKYNQNPSRPAATAYDAITVLAQAMNDCGTTTPDLKKCLLAVTDFPGASGPITIDQKQKRQGEVAELLVVKEGSVRATAGAL